MGKRNFNIFFSQSFFEFIFNSNTKIMYCKDVPVSKITFSQVDSEVRVCEDSFIFDVVSIEGRVQYLFFHSRSVIAFQRFN